MSVLDIWDFISGTGDNHPFDEAVAREVLMLLRQHFGNGQLQLLDLGGGAGNPSIALALSGHQVTLVDNDQVLLNAARQRGRRVNSPITIEQGDWRDYLERHSKDGNLYDAILFLGNSLAYQDTWPDRMPPTQSALTSLSDTFALCKKVLSPGGIIVIESPFEPESRQPWTYVRFYPPLDKVDIGSSDFSIWLVFCNPNNSIRIVDTIVISSPCESISEVKGRIAFTGWLLTKQVISAAANKVGLRTSFVEWPVRPLFSVSLISHGDE